MKIDYSQLSCYQRCPMRYYLTYVLNLAKVRYDERDIDREFGKLVHTYLELYMLKKDVSKVWSNFIDIEMNKCKTMQHGVILCQAYTKHYEMIDAHDEVLAVEVIDDFMIGDVKYIVKIDKVIRKNGNVYAVDYKTTGSKAYNFFNQFNPNMQPSGYTDYCVKKYGQCSGMIVDAMLIGFRQRKYKGEPPGFHYKFIREPVNRTSDQLRDFEQNVAKCCKRVRQSIDSNEWPKHEISCQDFRGCEFRELCMTSVGTELDQEIKQTLYEVVDTREYLKK